MAAGISALRATEARCADAERLSQELHSENDQLVSTHTAREQRLEQAQQQIMLLRNGSRATKLEAELAKAHAENARP